MSLPTHPMAETLAHALCHAQIEFHRQQLLQDVGSTHVLERALTQLIEAMDQLTVGQLVTREQVEAVVREYVFELELGGGLVELLGLMARRIHQQLRSEPLHVGELLNPQQAHEWLTKLLELQPLREALAQQLEHAELQAGLTDWLSQHVQRQLPHWVQDLQASRWRGKAWREAWLPGLSQGVSQRLVRIVLGQLQQLLRDPGELQSLAEILWDHAESLPLLGEEGPTADDVEDFLVLVYEFWRDLRAQPLLQHSVLGGVALFFDHYADQTLTELLSEIGLGAEDLYRQWRRFGPRVLQGLDGVDVLRSVIALWVQPFFDQPATRALLSQHLQAASGR